MTTHTLTTSQVIPTDIEHAWRFFDDVRNLARITPRSMAFELRAQTEHPSAGASIEYRVRPLFGVPMTWVSRIDAREAPHRFVDTQLRGPYASWHHEHRFTEVDGGVRIDDHVEYRMPWGRLGELGHRLTVRAQLEHLFDHRATALAQIFEPAGDAATARPGTIAVAGGTGFVGGEIARELRRRGRHVVVLSSRGEDARGTLPDDIEIRVADVTRDGDDLGAVLADIDELVISLAFPGLPVEQPSKGWTFAEVDAAGTRRLVESARESGVGRLVYVSGAGASHDAQRHWFRAKADAEDAVRASGLVWTILRPTWVYGPGDVSLNRFLGFARTLPFVPLTNLGRQMLAPVFVRDVARLAADSLEADAADGQVFEVGGPETMSMKEVLRRALRVADLRKPIIPGPTPLIKLAAWPMRFLPTPPLSPDAVDFVNQPATVDIEPLLRAMPRTLTRLESGLATYLGPRRSTVTIAEAASAELRPAA